MPISALHNALRAFRSGRLAFDDLSAEIDRQLTVERVAAPALLEMLRQQQASEPLPGDTFAAITQYILDWPQDPTIVTGPRREASGRRGVSVGVGDILQGRFSLVALAGEGGMSRVFKAIDLRRAEAGDLDPHVAVKVMTEPIADYVGSLDGFRGEVHKLRKLVHPNIVRVLDCGREGRAVFMVMEYLQGKSLQAILRAAGAAGLPAAEALPLLTAIGEALDFAHRHGMVHGDLKPGNVLVTDRDLVKVIDFGVSRLLCRADEAAAHSPKLVAITPRYASPERTAGADPEPADDVYAFACMVYEMLSGKHPGGNGDGGLPVRRPLRPPRMAAQQYTAILRGLAAERSKRTPDIRDFLDEFSATHRAGALKRPALLAAGAAMLIAAAYFALSHRPATPADPLANSSVAAAAATPVGSTIHDCAACPVLIVLPPGRFTQGSSGSVGPDAAYEQPRHRVLIGRSFAMSEHEITVAEYRRFAAATQRATGGCTTYDGRWEFSASASWQEPGFAQTDAHPATCVSWDDAVAYADWLTRLSGRSYRLPSASEWEYAARSGSDEGPAWNSIAEACVHANVADQSAALRFPGWNVFPCDDAYVNTAPVGSFQANAFGLRDMLGNAFEWVQDCWHDDYRNAPVDGTARMDEGCVEHELRGGSWFSAPEYVTPTYRNRFAHSYRSSSTGFRLVRETVP